jgi:putative transposase
MHRFVWRMRLRQVRQEHPRWGAKKLRRLLKRAFPQARRVAAVSTLARWLVEQHLVKKRKRRARRGPVLPRRGVHAVKGCNQVWTIDFKGWFRTGDGGRCEPLTVRDLFSRYVLWVALLPNQSDTAVRRVLAQVFRRYGLPKVIRVDNGAPFGGKGALGLSRLSVWWLRLGIAVEFVRPAHPEDNGAHEQMHRVFRADVAAPPAPSVAAQKRRIRAWIGCYNHERPHEALGQRVPAQMYWPSSRPLPQQLPKVKYPCAWETRRVRNRGHIKWQGRERFVGRAFVGQLVGLNKVAKGIHEVYLDHHLIGLLYERDLAGMRPASIARHS